MTRWRRSPAPPSLASGCQRVPISSNKSMIGHTLTAAGAVEAVFTVRTILSGVIPPTINYREPDPAIRLDVVPNEAREARGGRGDVEFLQNSGGRTFASFFATGP